jgi:hypothetical protein
VDEPLGAAHVRRRAGRFRRRAIAIVATAESRPSAAPHRLRALAREGQSETFECRLVARDQREFWVAGNVVVTAAKRRAGS